MITKEAIEAAVTKGRELAGEQPGALVEAMAEVAVQGAIAALSTITIAAGKIVAWRTFNEDGTSDVTERQDIADQWASDGFEVSPLVVASTLPIAGEGKVKALEWSEDSCGNWFSESPFGSEFIQKWKYSGIDKTVFEYDGTNYDTFEAAKAAAQTDYETRILSALISSPGNVPEGWQLVPKEMTDEMRSAFLSVKNCILDEAGYAVPILGQQYASMFDAAPSSPGKDGGQEVEAVAWTTQAQIDKFKVEPGCNAVMWGEPLPYHPDIPLYASPPYIEDALDAEVMIERLTKAVKSEILLSATMLRPEELVVTVEAAIRSVLSASCLWRRKP